MLPACPALAGSSLGRAASMWTLSWTLKVPQLAVGSRLRFWQQILWRGEPRAATLCLSHSAASLRYLDWLQFILLYNLMSSILCFTYSVKSGKISATFSLKIISSTLSHFQELVFHTFLLHLSIFLKHS